MIEGHGDYGLPATRKKVMRLSVINKNLTDVSARLFSSRASRIRQRFVNSIVYTNYWAVQRRSSINGGVTDLDNLSAFLSYANQYTESHSMKSQALLPNCKKCVACANAAYLNCWNNLLNIRREDAVSHRKL